MKQGRIKFLRLEWSMPKAFHVQPYREFYPWGFRRIVCETDDGPAVFWRIGPLCINTYSAGYWNARERFFKEFTP
jgi:hypothetical protein